MLEKLTKFASLIPLTAILIYLLGFLSLSAYLQSYGIQENIELDFSILRIGVLLAIVIGPIIFLSFADFTIGDFSKAEPDVADSVIHSLHDALGYSILYGIPLNILLLGYGWDPALVFLLVVLVIGFILNKIPVNRLVILLKGAMLIAPFMGLAIILTWGNSTDKTSLYFLQMGVFLTCAGLRIFNKSGQVFQLSKIGIIVTTLFYSAATFGEFVVGNIPGQNGGEKHTSVIYHILPADTALVSATSLKGQVSKTRTLTLQTIYQSRDFIYFKTKGKRVVALPKSFIESEEILIPSGFPADHY